MGYRHQVISDTMVPTDTELPTWFKTKYKGVIDFDRNYWASVDEYKRYGVLETFNEDAQKVLVELRLTDNIQLVYFADEGSICIGAPDIIHTSITASTITETRMIPVLPLEE